MKKLKVSLVNSTQKPIETLYWAFMNMHNKVPDNLDDIKMSEKEKEEFLEMLTAQPHQTVFEYLETSWLIEGASRAFQQQLTRTRTASFSIQSLRIVQVNSFADNGEYTKSTNLLSKPEAEKKVDETMQYIQKKYNELIAMGCPTEDARGILPLNIHSPITMTIDMRALYHMLELRFCDNTQEEYREVAKQMKAEIGKKMHSLLTKPMLPMCFKKGYCPSPFPCNKYPKFENKCTMDVSKWLKG